MRASPPAALIRFVASPSGSSISAFSRCSGISFWWFSRMRDGLRGLQEPRHGL
jgi:hypothetical protein